MTWLDFFSGALRNRDGSNANRARLSTLATLGEFLPSNLTTLTHSLRRWLYLFRRCSDTASLELSNGMPNFIAKRVTFPLSKLPCLVWPWAVHFRRPFVLVPLPLPRIEPNQHLRLPARPPSAGSCGDPPLAPPQFQHRRHGFPPRHLGIGPSLGLGLGSPAVQSPTRPRLWPLCELAFV